MHCDCQDLKAHISGRKIRKWGLLHFIHSHGSGDEYESHKCWPSQARPVESLSLENLPLWKAVPSVCAVGRNPSQSNPRPICQEATQRNLMRILKCDWAFKMCCTLHADCCFSWLKMRGWWRSWVVGLTDIYLNRFVEQGWCLTLIPKKLGSCVKCK